MSLDKKKSNSILLRALPSLHDLESPKQTAIFRMLGVDKDIREEVVALQKRLGITKKEGIGGPRRMIKIRTFWKKILTVDTQLNRQKAMKIIDKWIQYALGRSQDTTVSEKQRIEWVRTAAYLYQVWKSIARDYDASQIKAELERLKKLIGDELEKGS